MNSTNGQKRVLGLINARGGSKGIPNKNIKELNGKPLIAYSVIEALACPCLARVVVSTDSEAIAKTAREYGAETPFMRPPELATDESLQIDTVLHAVAWLEETGDIYDYVAILQPTSPLRSAEDITGTIDLLLSSGADSAITVTPLRGFHPGGLYCAGEKGALEPFMKFNPAGTNRQKLPSYLLRTGGVFAMKMSVLKQRSLYGQNTVGHVVPASRAVNVDDMLDWKMAEMLLSDPEFSSGEFSASLGEKIYAKTGL